MSEPIHVEDIVVPQELLDAIAQIEEGRRRFQVYRYGLIALGFILVVFGIAAVVAIFTLPPDAGWILGGLIVGLSCVVSIAVVLDASMWLTRHIGTMKNGIPVHKIRDDPRSQGVANVARVISLYHYKRGVILTRSPGWYEMINRIDKERESVQTIIDLTCTALKRDGPLGTASTSNR